MDTAQTSLEKFHAFFRPATCDHCRREFGPTRPRAPPRSMRTCVECWARTHYAAAATVFVNQYPPEKAR